MNVRERVNEIAARCVELGISPAKATAGTPDRDFVRQYSMEVWDRIFELNAAKVRECRPAKLTKPKPDDSDDLPEVEPDEPGANDLDEPEADDQDEDQDGDQDGDQDPDQDDSDEWEIGWKNGVPSRQRRRE